MTIVAIPGGAVLGEILDTAPNAPPTFWPRRASDLWLTIDGDIAPAPDMESGSAAMWAALELHYERRELVRVLYALILFKVIGPQMFLLGEEFTISIEDGRFVVINYLYRPAFHCPTIHTVIV